MNAKVAATVIAVLVLLVAAVVFLSSRRGVEVPVVEASPTPITATASPTAVPTPEPSPTPSPTVVPTVSPAPTPTPVPTPGSYTISGRVTDAATGQPLSGFTVWVHEADGFCSVFLKVPQTPYVAGTRTKADGTFAVEVPNGRYLLRFSQPRGSGYQYHFWNGKSRCEDADVVVVNGANVDGIDFVLLKR